ncbi:acyl-CoA synthetase [Amaricoccus sp.]|uniref:acyl-CoA synthetase n=1 Tax=Amaricoccus sp. TaxID=1872485 RepID=UPI001B73D651|nr:acyl-CoA synthetase [Amaricoccus sp.]MBP7002234.1 acyl-CoA synthetase [Amaricoccus sp.]
MLRIATIADKEAVEAEAPFEARMTARTLHQQLRETAGRFPGRRATTFRLKSGPADKVVSLTWSELLSEVTRAANLLRRLGVGPQDAVAYILPNCLEAPVALLAGATAGVVVPINPLLSAPHIGGLLEEVGAKVVVTLAPFPKTDLAQKVAEAVALAPTVTHVLEVDLARYLAPPVSWIVPFLRPKLEARNSARRLDFRKACAAERGDALDFPEADPDRACAAFHTGGTTGLPRIARHRARGILYNGWLGSSYIFSEQDVLMCPLPMFHVLAAYPIFMSCLVSGAELVLPTPQGYRGEGVIANFWKLVARHRATFLIIVPTAASALMQRPVDADVSTLRFAISGSAAMPVELFHRFEAATGLKICEGYGMTEATCLVSINPPWGERKVGSVGFPFVYTDVKIRDCDLDGAVLRDCGPDEVGEICVKNPGVNPEVYADAHRNRGMLTPDGYLRTGDLGRLDADGYIWITGRAKDLIIRGGHNIDPSTIEEALLGHPAVALAGAIGQPDAHSGEAPAVYVELVAGGEATPAELSAWLAERVPERAAAPKHVEVLPELPKTAVGKIFKPDLRRLAIARVFDATLAAAGAGARVGLVEEDRRLGLVAVLDPGPAGAAEADTVAAALAPFVTRWRWRSAAA